MNERRPGPGLVREPLSEYAEVQRLTATEAARGFSELLNRVRYRGERFLITRGGVDVCEMRPAAAVRFSGTDLGALLRSMPAVDGDFLDQVERHVGDQPPEPEPPWQP